MNGILCIDKPAGFTSFDVVAKLRGIAKTKKIGHGGTLDPMATGVLPLFLGNATKACDLVPNQDKRYTATFRLGMVTDTLDCTGKILEEHPVTATQTQVKEALYSFVGTVQQLPPMYSAVQVNGVRLYDLARQGKEVERTPREVTFYQIDLLGADTKTHTYTVDVSCSKGTYIRSLCHDVGQILGCGAVLTQLQRTQAGDLTIGDCLTIDQVQQLALEGNLAQQLRPVETVFCHLPKLVLDQRLARLLLNGVRLGAHQLDWQEQQGNLAVYTQSGRFLGLVCMDQEDKQLRVVKLFEREAAE